MSKQNFLEKLLDGAEVEWKALREVGELIRGNGLPKRDFTESGVPAIHYGQIYTYYGLSTTSTISFVSPESAKKLRKVNSGDVVITNTSENFEDVGTALVYLGEEQAVTGGHATIFKPSNNILGKYLAYFTQTATFEKIKRKHARGAKVIDVSARDMSKIKIPIPFPNNPKKSLAIQAEIVRILDTFSALTTELTTELSARKKQYNYYRDQLLTVKHANSKETTLGNILDMRAGRHIKAKDINNTQTTEHKYICYGGNGSRGFVRDYSHDGNHVLIGRQGALCGNTKRARKQFYATEHAVVCSPKNGVNIDWIFYILTFMDLNKYKSKSAQPGLAVSKIAQLPITVPPPKEQAQIVTILDKFDTLTHSISEGLPREIELRQKQYEYYRDLLLSFPKPKEAAV